jgi:hypothetical protein
MEAKKRQNKVSHIWINMAVNTSFGPSARLLVRPPIPLNLCPLLPHVPNRRQTLDRESGTLTADGIATNRR